MRSRRAPAAPGSRDLYGGAHTVAVAVVAETFRTLGMGVSVIHGTRPERWDTVFVPDFNVIHFEWEYGKARPRERYNQAAIARAWATGQPSIARHAGFSDLFVPVRFESGSRVTLASGPFSPGVPSASQLREQWRWLTRRSGSLSDPEFLRYVDASLGTLRLDGDALEHFVALLQCFAALLGGRGSAAELGTRARALRQELLSATEESRMWAAAEGLTDPRTSRSWHGPLRWAHRFDLRVEEPPEFALVGLLSVESTAADELTALLRRDEFQRSVVRLARRTPNALAGRVARHGVFLLLPDGGSRKRTEALLEDHGERLRRLAREKTGLRLAVGVGPVAAKSSVVQRYEVALAAAERALFEGRSSLALDAAPSIGGSVRQLLASQAGVITALEESPEHAAAANEHWLSGVVARSGFSVDVVRGYLAANLERVASAVERSDVFDARAFEQWLEAAMRDLQSAQTLRDATAAQRRALADAVAARREPLVVRSDQRIRRALAHIHEHFAGELSEPRVARLVGLAPAAFSRAFRAQVGTTFVRYALGLRLERARTLLERTKLPLAAVAKLAGFGSVHYFHRAFTREYGSTPGAYRRGR